MIARTQIVATTRTWLGTPFQHQGRIKGRGVDCVGLPLCVMAELGVTDLLADYRNYPSQPTGRVVHEECQRRLIEKTMAEMLPGDLLTLRVPTVPCHTAIITDLNGGLGIIHAYNGGPRRVVEHILDAKWRRRIEGVFEFPGIQGEM